MLNTVNLVWIFVRLYFSTYHLLFIPTWMRECWWLLMNFFIWLSLLIEHIFIDLFCWLLRMLLSHWHCEVLSFSYVEEVTLTISLFGRNWCGGQQLYCQRYCLPFRGDLVVYLRVRVWRRWRWVRWCSPCIVAKKSYKFKIRIHYLPGNLSVIFII